MNRTVIDLVDRLRISWTSCHARVNDERAEAADEIERLRAEVKTLQAGWRLARIKADAIEAMGFRWEWSRAVGLDGEQEGGWVEPKRGEDLDLRGELAACRVAYEQAIRDRDDARRRYCHDVWQGVGDEDEQRQLTPREIATRMGWTWPRGGSEATK